MSRTRNLTLTNFQGFHKPKDLKPLTRKERRKLRKIREQKADFLNQKTQETGFFSFLGFGSKKNKQSEDSALDDENNYIPEGSHFTKEVFMDFISRGNTLFKKYSKNSDLSHSPHAKTTRIDLIDIKEKKQMHLELHNFSRHHQNKEFIITDDKIVIVDFKRQEIAFNHQIHKIWDPIGQPFWLGYWRGLSVLAFIDFNGLNIIEGYIEETELSFDPTVNFRRYVVDEKVKGNLEFDSHVSSQKKRLRFYLKKFIGKDGYGYGEIKELRRYRSGGVSGARKTSLEGFKDVFGVSGGVCRFGVKTGNLRIGRFTRKGLSLMRFVYHQKRAILVLVTEKKIRRPKKLKNKKNQKSGPKQKFFVINLYKAHTKRLIRSFKIRVMHSETLISIKTHKSKICLRVEKKLFLINFVRLAVYQIRIRASDRCFFTKKKDHLSNSSGRLKMFKGVTIIDTRFKGMTEGECYDVIRLKKGDIVIKLDYSILRLYYNITKKRLELVVRLDLPSEISTYFDGHCLYETPNINQLRRFYLKVFDVESRKMDISLHKLFKKVTTQYQKRFKTVYRLENTPRIYIEAVRLVESPTRNPRGFRGFKARGGRAEEEFRPLVCIEYDFLSKRVLFFELPISEENSFFPVGEDLDWAISEAGRESVQRGVDGRVKKGQKSLYLRDEDCGIVYMFDSERRLIKLIRKYERAEVVDLGWLERIMEQKKPKIGKMKNSNNEKNGSKMKQNGGRGMQMGSTNPVDEFFEFDSKDNFGNFTKTGLENKYFFYSNRAYYNNGTSLICLDFVAKTRRIVINDLKYPKNLLLHFDRKTSKLIIFDNSLTLHALNMLPDGSEGELWTYKLKEPIIQKLANRTNLKQNYVNTQQGAFMLVSEHNIFEFSFPNAQKYTQKLHFLQRDSDVYQTPTIAAKDSFYKVLSGETVLNLETGDYQAWRVSNQFIHLKTFISNFIKISAPEPLKPPKEDFSEDLVIDYDRNLMFNFLEKLYYDALKFKQIGFVFFELGLQLSQFLVLFGDPERLQAYIDCVYWFDIEPYKGVLEIDEVKAYGLLDRIEKLEEEFSPTRRRKKRRGNFINFLNIFGFGLGRDAGKKDGSEKAKSEDSCNRRRSSELDLGDEEEGMRMEDGFVVNGVGSEGNDAGIRGVSVGGRMRLIRLLDGEGGGGEKEGGAADGDGFAQRESLGGGPGGRNGVYRSKIIEKIVFF